MLQIRALLDQKQHELNATLEQQAALSGQEASLATVRGELAAKLDRGAAELAAQQALLAGMQRDLDARMEAARRVEQELADRWASTPMYK